MLEPVNMDPNSLALKAGDQFTIKGIDRVLTVPEGYPESGLALCVLTPEEADLLWNAIEMVEE